MDLIDVCLMSIRSLKSMRTSNSKWASDEILKVGYFVNQGSH